MSKTKAAGKAPQTKKVEEPKTPTAVRRPAKTRSRQIIAASYEVTRRDEVQASLNERNTASDLLPNRLFERIRDVDPTV